MSERSRALCQAGLTAPEAWFPTPHPHPLGICVHWSQRNFTPLCSIKGSVALGSDQHALNLRSALLDRISKLMYQSQSLVKYSRNQYFKQKGISTGEIGRARKRFMLSFEEDAQSHTATLFCHNEEDRDLGSHKKNC